MCAHETGRQQQRRIPALRRHLEVRANPGCKPTVVVVRMQLRDYGEACDGSPACSCGRRLDRPRTRLLQGFSMTGSTFWAIVGALCVIAGLGLLSWPWRQSPADL